MTPLEAAALAAADGGDPPMRPFYIAHDEGARNIDEYGLPLRFGVAPTTRRILRARERR